MDLGEEFQKIYDSEINVRISWLCNGEIDIWLGDDVNGYLVREAVASISDIVPWLQEAIAHFYPNSTYANSLDSDVKDRSARRLFQPPKIGAQSQVPTNCGAPHASPVAFDQLMAFTCHHCGAAVEVPPPKVQ